MARSKYGNRRVKLAGHTFDSLAEAWRYQELCIRVRTGEISRLEVHPRFKLHVNGKLVCTYVADFSYVDLSPEGTARRIVVEDVKGVATQAFKVKANLFEAVYGFPVTVVPAGRVRK